MNQALTCPLTLCPFVDPVIDPEGNTYEKSAILAWLAQHGTSPITRTPLTAGQLAPNRAILDLLASAAAPGASSSNPNPSSSSSLPPPLGIANPIYAPPVVRGPLELQAEVGLRAFGNFVEVTVSQTDGAPEIPHATSTVCVIDVSGSMGDLAVTKNASGESETTGLTLLDLVVHATRSIMHSLGPADLLSLVTFSDSAKVVLPPTTMNEEGLVKASEVLSSLRPQGSTNLWAGVSKALELVAGSTSHFASIMLLTDGVPTDTSLDYAGALRRALSKKPLFGRLMTFGFGYSIDSEILRGLAIEGGGFFSFIPDAAILGTAFINAATDSRTIMGVNGVLTIDAPAGSEVPTPILPLRSLPASSLKPQGPSVTTTQLALPPLRYGQGLTIAFASPLPAGARVSLAFEILDGAPVSRQAEVPASPDSSSNLAELAVLHKARTDAAAALFRLAACKARTKEMKDASAPSIEHLGLDSSFLTNGDALAAGEVRTAYAALVKDMTGQIMEAISRDDWFGRWGRFYSLGLAFAHSLQFCSNFKDASVQPYGNSALFQKLHDEMTDSFLSLPPPVPTGRPQRTAYGSHRSSSSNNFSPASPISMTSYYDQDCVCLHPDVALVTATGESVAIRSLVKGDRLLLADGRTSAIQCVTRSLLPLGGTRLVDVDGRGTWVTPYHPVLVPGQAEFAFPADTEHPIVDFVPCDAVFNLVLEQGARGAVTTASGVALATLGHNLVGGVVNHPFFGSNRVVESLMDNFQAEFEAGLVTLVPESIIRSPTTGLIDNLKNKATEEVSF